MITPFRVVVADPPWQFRDKLGKRGADAHYQTMALHRLKRMRLPPIADDAALYMWRLSSMIPEAYELVDAWGFKHKTEIVWRKLTTKGRRWFCLGHYIRGEHETCIVATRGKITPKVRNIRSVFDAEVPLGQHSAKPEELQNIAERMFDGTYAELFARRIRPGWSCYGNEVVR